MMKWVFSGLIFLSVIFGVLTGHIEQVSNAAISEGSKAVTLVISLLGAICLWDGLMAVAEKSGLTKIIANILSPITKILFKGLDKNSKALKVISMNITANLLGLGNAATPLGIQAMQELEKENKVKGVASNHMITLVVLNTASIQLIPTTIAMLRYNSGASNPMDVLPAILLTSLASVTVGLLMVKFFGLKDKCLGRLKCSNPAFKEKAITSR